MKAGLEGMRVAVGRPLSLREHHHGLPQAQLVKDGLNAFAADPFLVDGHRVQVADEACEKRIAKQGLARQEAKMAAAGQADQQRVQIALMIGKEDGRALSWN